MTERLDHSHYENGLFSSKGLRRAGPDLPALFAFHEGKWEHIKHDDVDSVGLEAVAQSQWVYSSSTAHQ